MKAHPISSIPFFAATMLERAGYYGLRAIIVLFLIDGAINCTAMEAMEIYGFGIGFMAFSNLIGGALGFIGNPKIVSMVGIGLQAIAAFVIAYSDTKETVMAGFVLIGFGAGIARPNLLPFLGQLYQRSKLLDAGMMINYIMINIGAFTSAMAIGFIVTDFGFRTGFILCGLLYMAAALLIYFVKPNENISTEEPEQANSFFPLLVGLAVVGSAIFWLIYEFVMGDFYSLTASASDDTITSLIGNSSSINGVVILIFCTCLAIYFSFKKVATTLQLGLGFALGVLAYLCLYAVDFQAGDSGMIKSALFGFFITITLAEVLVGPPIASYIVRKLDVRYSPMVIAGFYFLTAIILKFQGANELKNFAPNLTAGILILLVFAGVFIGFYLNGKKYNNDENEVLENEFDF